MCKGLEEASVIGVWEGIELLGSTPSPKRGIRNNVLYRVVSLDEDVYVCRVGGDEVVRLTFVQAAAWLRLSFARTYASVQGTEFDEPLRLHDTTNRHFTMRHLFVALSRARDGSKIDIN